MEANERRVKDAGISLLTIGWSGSQSLVGALRSAIFRVRYVNTLHGEQSCHNYLKSIQGKRFKDEGKFTRIVNDQGNGKVIRTAVSQEDVHLLHKLCSRYGVDYLLQKRPIGLEEWSEKKFLKGEKLNSNEEKVLESFILRDSKGVMIENPDKPGLPLLKECDYMLTFKESDVDRWDMICTALEERQRGLKKRIVRAEQNKKIKEVEKKRGSVKKEKEGFIK